MIWRKLKRLDSGSTSTSTLLRSITEDTMEDMPVDTILTIPSITLATTMVILITTNVNI